MFTFLTSCMARVDAPLPTLLLDTLPTNQIRAWEKGFLVFVKAQFPQVGDAIRTSKALAKDTEADLKRAIEQFGKQFNH